MRDMFVSRDPAFPSGNRIKAIVTDEQFWLPLLVLIFGILLLVFVNRS